MSSDNLEEPPFPAPPGIVYRAGKKVGGAICPRCPTFITTTSKVVRLYQPEKPNSVDGRSDKYTGKFYYWDGRPINMQPRWFVHERCWTKKK